MRKPTFASLSSVLALCVTSPLSAQEWTLDPGFSGSDVTYEWQGVYGSVNSVHCYADGRILIGGVTTTYRSDLAQGLARLLTNGAFDTTFSVGSGSSRIRSFVVQEDGRIVVAGGFDSWGGTTKPGIVRLMPDGTVDSSFDPGQGISPVEGPNITSHRVLRLQPDGKILVGGGFISYDGQVRHDLIRLHENGQLDSTFSPTIFGQQGVVMDVGILPNGNMVVCGSLNLTPYRNVVILDSTGALVSDAPPFTGFVTHVRVLPDGRSVLAGSPLAYNGVAVPDIVRMDLDGALDTTFNTDLIGLQIFDIQVDHEGRVMVGGRMTGQQADRVLWRLESDGAIDPTFDMDPSVGGMTGDQVGPIGIQGDGAIIACGNLQGVNPLDRNYSRLLGTGAVDTTFRWVHEERAQVRAIIPLDDQRKLVVGSFTRCGIHGTHGSAIIDANGVVDPTYTVAYGNLGMSVHGAVIHPNGQPVLYGANKDNSVQAPSIWQMTLTGTREPLYANGGPTLASGLAARVSDVAVYPDGRVVMVGSMDQMQNTSVSDVVRLMPSGTLDTQFMPVVTYPGEPEPELSAVLLLPDERIVVTGGFSTFGGAVRTGIAMLYSNGVQFGDFPFDDAWQIGCSGGAACMISGVLHSSNDKLLLWGNFDSYAGTPVGGVVRIAMDGAIDPAFAVGTGANGTVHRVVERSNGTYLVVGSFSSFNGVPAEDLVLISTSGEVLSVLEPGEGPAHESTEPGADPSVDAYLLDLLETPQGVIVVGDFTYFAGQPKQHIVRLTNDLLTEVPAMKDRPLEVLPNPTSGLFQLRSNGVEDVLLTTMDGRTVPLGPISKHSGLLQLDISHLPAGLYLMRGRDRAGNEGVARVVKQ